MKKIKTRTNYHLWMLTTTIYGKDLMLLAFRYPGHREHT